MPDDRKQCWLMEGCPSRTGACYSCVPDGDGCPIWRWFKKQILPKEQEAVVRCKDCKWYIEGYDIDGKWFTHCDGSVRTYGHTRPDWFCADGKPKD